MDIRDRVLTNTKNKKPKAKVILMNDKFKLPVEVQRFLNLEGKVNYIEFYISEDYPDAFVLKPLEYYVEPDMCFVCDNEVSEFITYKGKKICLECKSIIDGSKVYNVNRVAIRYTKKKTARRVPQEEISYPRGLVDWCIMCGSKKEIDVIFLGKNLCDDCRKYLIKYSKNRKVKKIILAV